MTYAKHMLLLRRRISFFSKLSVRKTCKGGNATKSFTLTFSAARRSRHKASALPEAATSSEAGVFLRTAQTLFKTAYGFYSPPRFAGGKPVVGLLYRALPILQNQLLPQVCFMQTCSGRNSFAAINLHTVRPPLFPQQNDSGNSRLNNENRSLSTSLLMQTRAGGISVISCRIPFSAARNLPAKIRPCKSRPP